MSRYFPHPLALLVLLMPGPLPAAGPGWEKTAGAAGQKSSLEAGVFSRTNLAAWCIVPFDGSKRGPEARAAMLAELGLTKLVYDYRAEHIPQWEEELEALQRHRITLLGWWFPQTLNEEARQALALFRKYKVRPQLWVMGSGSPLEETIHDTPAQREARIAAEAARFRPLAEAAAEAGCPVGIYNHGGWSGEPENALAVVEALRAQGVANMGIVYNLHHGHAHLDRLAGVLPRLVPHLLCFNLNGMEPDGEQTGRKILPLGAGSRDLAVLRQLRASGYTGPVGILNHTDADARARLQDNLDGLTWLLPQLDDLPPPGPRPAWRTWKESAVEAETMPAPPQTPASGAQEDTPGKRERRNEGARAPVKPAVFTPELAPLKKEDNQHWQAFVNRERIFDFYSKQARHFMDGGQPAPELLGPYPGLDSGLHGHWGNQTDDVTWRDGRFAASDLGPVFSTVFRGAGLTIPKGICVRAGHLSACFDPETLTFPAVWRNGFLKLSDARHGFMGGGVLDGEVLRAASGVLAAGSDKPGNPSGAPEVPARPGRRPGDRWHGFYRHGTEVIFSWTRGGVKTLATVRTHAAPGAAADSGPSAQETQSALERLTHGGPAQWPQWITTRGTTGTQEPFATDTVTVPFENPYGTLFFLTAHDFFPDGTAAVCTMTGEVWLVRGLDADLREVRWKRYATGLHQPLGLRIHDGALYVLGRDQITRLHDLNGDAEADFYECVSNAMITSPGGHDYITGLECDDQGRFLFASGNQGLCRLTLPEKVEILATGFRNPNGMGLSPDGRFATTSVQEGDWTPASAVCQVRLDGPAATGPQAEPPHFGAGGPRRGEAPALPLLQLPRGEDNSASAQAFLTGTAWPALIGTGGGTASESAAGNLVHLSSGTGSAWLVMRQEVNGLWQAAAVRLAANFDSGAQCARFREADGHLYVTGLQGWGSYTPHDGCFQRVRFNPASVIPVPVACEARGNGVLLRFSRPLEAATAGQAARHFAQSWHYQYSAGYGSQEWSGRHPGLPGHDVLTIRSAHVLEDGRSLFLEIPDLAPAGQIHLHVSTGADRRQDIFLTTHATSPDFTGFPGFTARPSPAETGSSTGGTVKSMRPGPEAAVLAAAPAPEADRPNPWAAGTPGRAVTVEAAEGLQFARKSLTVRAGERLSLTFRNPDTVPHNWVLTRPGTLQAMGTLTNHMISAPDGLARHYVPDSPEILAWTDMTPPGGECTIHFGAPAEPGDYPFFCTFPGHWMVMHGVLKVE